MDIFIMGYTVENMNVHNKIQDMTAPHHEQLNSARKCFFFVLPCLYIII